MSEFLMLAHTFKPEKDRVGGWFLSEKLDGSRCFWDGGISRGKMVKDVPYANKIKDKRYVDPPVATGLWSRAGKAIQAPDWWLDEMPKTFLDGELWIGRGRFQELRSIIAQIEPGPRWQFVKFMAFDIPPAIIMGQRRDIKIRNDYEFSVYGVFEDSISCPGLWTFEYRNIALEKRCERSKVAVSVTQLKLPLKSDDCLSQIDISMESVLAEGGEGVILHNPASYYETNRSHHLLKHKPINTADGMVVGYTSGVEGKTGRLLGKVGAIILDFNGKVMKLSGLTDEQRLITDSNIRMHAEDYPSEELPENYSHHLFPLGCIIEFKYRELTNDGIPKEARFLRIKE